MANEQLTRDAIALPLKERVRLAETLWESIHLDNFSSTGSDEGDTLAQVLRRDAELSSGSVEGESHDEVMGAARRAIGCV